MIEKLDKRIASLESELAELKQKKVAILQAQLAEAQASLTGGGAAPVRRRGRGSGSVIGTEDARARQARPQTRQANS
jgi:hypothetical protein